MSKQIDLNELARAKQSTNSAVESQTGKYSDAAAKLPTEKRFMQAPMVAQKKQFKLNGG